MRSSSPVGTGDVRTAPRGRSVYVKRKARFSERHDCSLAVTKSNHGSSGFFGRNLTPENSLVEK